MSQPPRTQTRGTSGELPGNCPSPPPQLPKLNVESSNLFGRSIFLLASDREEFDCNSAPPFRTAHG